MVVDEQSSDHCGCSSDPTSHGEVKPLRSSRKETGCDKEVRDTVHCEFITEIKYPSSYFIR